MMAKYRITGPDGATYEITAPDDATQDDVMAYAQQNYGQAQGSEPPSSQAQAPVDYTAIAARENYDALPWYQKPFVAAGAEMTRLGRGVGQLLTPDDSEWGKSLQASVDSDAAYQDGIHGVSGFVGRALPYIATLPLGGPEAAALGRVGQAGRLAQTAVKAGTAAAEGAAYGSLGEVRTGQSRLENAGYGALGGLAGRGLVGGARGALGTLARESDPILREGVEVAQREGIPLHVSQVAQSTPAKFAASAAKYLPFSGAGAAGRQQQNAWNRALTRAAGDATDRLDDAWVAKTRNTLGDTYDDIWNRNDVSISNDRLRQMVDAVKTANNSLTGEEANLVGKQLDRVLADIEAAGGSGTIPGRVYQSLRGTLAAVKPGTDVGSHVNGIRRALEGAAEDSLSGADSALLAQTNKRWNNFKTLEKLLERVPGAKADVSPSALWGAVNGRGPKATKEFRDLAKLGQNLLKDPVPQNGLLGSGLGNLASAGLGGLAGGGTVAPLLAALAVGPIAGRALNSGALGNMLAKGAGKPNSVANLLASTGAIGSARSGAGRLNQLALIANSEPLEISVSGGRVGPAPTAEEMAALRAQMAKGGTR